MKENKKSPFVVFENAKITKKQQEHIEKLLDKYSNERDGSRTLSSEETPSFMIMRSICSQSKKADKLFSSKTARGQLIFVLEGIKRKHFGKDDLENNESLLENFSSLYYNEQDQLFTKIESKGFSGVFAECCPASPSILIAGVVNGSEKNIHLYYGYMANQLVISNEASLLKELCEEIKEIKDNTFIKYDFNTQKMTIHQLQSMKKQKKRKELEKIKEQLKDLYELYALENEAIELKKCLIDDGK